MTKLAWSACAGRFAESIAGRLPTSFSACLMIVLLKAWGRAYRGNYGW